jgi:gamma-glutamylcyclotransferase (GGCT)/AIG2-like uncharacterized protein YtfP
MVHFLFSYGTLQLEKVQLASFGRKLVGKPDRLYSYKLGQLVITDPSVLEKSNQNVHPIAIKTNDSKNFIEGMIFEITENELKQADAYEVEDYERVLEKFASGQSAWIYVKKEML